LCCIILSDIIVFSKKKTHNLLSPNGDNILQ